MFSFSYIFPCVLAVFALKDTGTHAKEMNSYELRFLQEQDTLLKELDQWKNSQSGQVAQQNGFVQKGNGIQSVDDQLRRFFNTKLEVEKLNGENPSATFSVDSPFTLMTDEEFLNYVKRSSIQTPPVLLPINVTNIPTPTKSNLRATSKDWTTTGCVAPVKNQGSCGSCWAFAAVAAIESGNCIRGGNLQLFSEQQLTSCDTSSSGCNGGSSSRAMTYVSKTGLCSATDYPYTSGKTGNTGNCLNSCNKVKVPVKGAISVTKTDAGLIQAIDVQPVVVSVTAGNSAWKQYKSGVLSSCNSNDVNHAVLAVGYGDSNGSPYYKIKNSWGSSWGDAGYIYLKRGVSGVGACAVLTRPTYPAF